MFLALLLASASLPEKADFRKPRPSNTSPSMVTFKTPSGPRSALRLVLSPSDGEYAGTFAFTRSPSGSTSSDPLIDTPPPSTEMSSKRVDGGFFTTLNSALLDLRADLTHP